MNDSTKAAKTIYLRELGWLREDDRRRVAALPQELREGSEVILAAMNGATVGDPLAVKKLGELVKRAQQLKLSDNAERYAVFLALLPREWEYPYGSGHFDSERKHTPFTMNEVLSEYHPRFRSLTREQFEAAKANGRSDVLFVGEISAAVNAFGDREKSAAAERYEGARREGDKHLAAFGRTPATRHARVDPRST